jgi:hypothetical protein
MCNHIYFNHIYFKDPWWTKKHCWNKSLLYCRLWLKLSVRKSTVTTLSLKQQRRKRVHYTTPPGVRFARHVWYASRLYTYHTISLIFSGLYSYTYILSYLKQRKYFGSMKSFRILWNRDWCLYPSSTYIKQLRTSNWGGLLLHILILNITIL